MASPEPPDASDPALGVPSDLTQQPSGVSHLRRYVSLRGPNARMWMTVAYFSAVLTLGFLVVVGSLVWTLVSGDPPIGSVVLWSTAAVVMAFVGPGSNVVVVRGLPQRITRQGISADSDGVTVLQERKWWFPGEGTFIAWPEIRRIREVHVGGRRLTYFIEFVLDTHRTDPELPSWAETAESLALEEADAATQFYVQVPEDVKERILRMVERTAPLPSVVERSEPLR
ncbi:hypothetical protein KIK06_12135 [Nocardiopsis sp. EMB25]|uniref:hypothetical protein n=1 Tax=Nocardiopsis TaxID=2013 RepID=UPI000347785E|nr:MULTISPECIES: hypothetical protein [Nocardiopsis]MCY9784641.1 hypothetical protein [Nocardiopsis sp. EMB25]